MKSLAFLTDQNMAVETYSPDIIKAGFLHLTGYFIQLLAKAAVLLSLDTELRALKIVLPVDLEVHDLDLEVTEILTGAAVEVMRTSIFKLIDAQDSFLLINALSIDQVEDHEEAVDLTVGIVDYFLVPMLEYTSGHVPTEISCLYRNQKYLLYLFAYLLFHGHIDLDSKEFEGYWTYEIDEKVFYFIKSGEKSISLISSVIDQLDTAMAALDEIWRNTD